MKCFFLLLLEHLVLLYCFWIMCFNVLFMLILHTSLKSSTHSFICLPRDAHLVTISCVWLAIDISKNQRVILTFTWRKCYCSLLWITPARDSVLRNRFGSCNLANPGFPTPLNEWFTQKNPHKHTHTHCRQPDKHLLIWWSMRCACHSQIKWQGLRRTESLLRAQWGGCSVYRRI